VLAEFTHAPPADRERSLLAPVTTERKENKERPMMLTTWLLGGLSLASAGASTGLWLSARSDYDKLSNSCAPNCTSEQTKTTETKLLFADIGVGVAVAAGIGAVVSHVVRPEVTTGERAQNGALRVGAAVSPSSGLVTVTGGL